MHSNTPVSWLQSKKINYPQTYSTGESLECCSSVGLFKIRFLTVLDFFPNRLSFCYLGDALFTSCGLNVASTCRQMNAVDWPDMHRTVPTLLFYCLQSLVSDYLKWYWFAMCWQKIKSLSNVACWAIHCSRKLVLCGKKIKQLQGQFTGIILWLHEKMVITFLNCRCL